MLHQHSCQLGRRQMVSAVSDAESCLNLVSGCVAIGDRHGVPILVD
jgi:hypothetical protein